MKHDRKALPAVSLINLLRLNGITAELVLVSMQRENSASPPAFSDKIGSVLVYVPTLDRYVDPVATKVSDSSSLDRIVKASAVRAHLNGPAPNADPAFDVCDHVCMNVYLPRHDPYVARVATEAIHVP
jgi:hypothetical protein